MKYVIGCVLVVLAIFSVLFLGGLASAAWEIRGERKAGKPVTRPGWDRIRNRRAHGGWLGSARIAWANKRTALDLCGVCGLGPVVWFPAIDQGEIDGLGCSAWEAGHVEAILTHDRAGGYSRSPAAA